MNKKISEISQRAKFIFKVLVENYLSTGQPMGSKSISSKLSYDLSPATIRNVLNEINLHGLIQRDHFSAGSLPSDLGLQFYTQALLEPGQINKNEKQLIDSTKFTDFSQEYEKITSILNGLSNQASLVINKEKIPKISKISFHTIDKKRVIFIVDNEDGTTTNRLVETPENIELRDLNIISEFLNKFTNNQSPIQIEKNIKIFLQEAQNEINKTIKMLLEQGIKINVNNKSEKFFVRGLPSLVNSKIDTDLDALNELLSEIETGKMASKMIKALKKSKGVQIFIGSNTNLFKNTNLSMIFSNYQTKNGLTGAIGVIGPKRIDYQRIVPIVNYMSEIISKKNNEE
jgi:heat-inducible transcriptional repressor